MTANTENPPLATEPSAHQGPVMGVGSGALFASVLSGDCLQVMATLEAGSIDAIITDLPYGTTACKWDAVIPFAPLWEQVRRVLKPNGVFVTTASQPFTTALIASNPKDFRYCLVWDKKGTTGFQTAKTMPLRRHEDIVVFYSAKPTYNPEKEVRGKPRKKGGSKVDNGCYGELRSTESFNNEYYPTSIVEISNASKRGKSHPTQKPVELMRYLIRTYTNPGETVLDPCCGSGTTGVAAQLEGRNCVLIEREEEYLEITRQRLLANIQDHRPLPESAVTTRKETNE